MKALKNYLHFKALVKIIDIFGKKNITVESVKVKWIEQGFSTDVRIRDFGQA